MGRQQAVERFTVGSMHNKNDRCDHESGNTRIDFVKTI
jgi:hypothetical protein